MTKCQVVIGPVIIIFWRNGSISVHAFLNARKSLGIVMLKTQELAIVYVKQMLGYLAHKHR